MGTTVNRTDVGRGFVQVTRYCGPAGPRDRRLYSFAVGAHGTDGFWGEADVCLNPAEARKLATAILADLDASKPPAGWKCPDCGVTFASVHGGPGNPCPNGNCPSRQEHAAPEIPYGECGS